VLKVDPEGGDLVAATPDELARLRAQSEGWSESDLLRLLRLASEVGGPMRDSPHPLIHLEAAVLQMATLEPGDTLAELLDRLDALEARLGGATGGATGGGGARAPQRAAPGTPAPPSGAPPSAPPSRGPAGGMRASAPTGAGPRFAPGPAHAPNAAPTPPRERPSAPPAPGGGPLRASAAAPTPATAPAPMPAAVATAIATAPVDEAPVADAAALSAWQRALAAVNQRKRMLGAFLEDCRFLGAASDAVLIAMDDLHRAVVEEKDNRAILTDELTRAFARPLDVRCMPLAEAGLEPRRPPQAADVAPLIERAIDFFQGDVLDRRPGRTQERTDG
jgi:hypothetical protein